MCRDYILQSLEILRTWQAQMVAGSGIGGMKVTQEMVDFAAKHNITADIEVVPVDYKIKTNE